MKKERTLVLMKPDAVQRGVVGELLSRFEKVGLKIIGMKMLSPDEKHYHQHYEGIGKMISRRGQQAFDVTLEFMKTGPVIAIVFEGIEAVELVRKMVGPTEPKSAVPGTIRGDYAHMTFGYADKAKKGIPNLVHASGDSKEAEQEIKHWFKEEELFDSYKTTHERFTSTLE